MSILIKNIDILTMIESDNIIRSGCILIENDLISYIGSELPLNFKFDTLIDGKGKLAMPGLINCHAHSPMTLLRSYADDMHLEKWLFEYIFPIEEKLTGEDIYWGSMLAIAEKISSGTTTFSDMYYFMDYIAEASIESGIRAFISRGCQKFSENDENGVKRLNENIELFNKYHLKGEGRISVGIGPHAVYTCIPEYLKECCAVSKDLNTLLHIHLSETKFEVEGCIEKYGTSPIKHCYNLGILNNRILAAHCVHPSDDEIDILRETQVNVVHNPTSNLKLASGTAPVNRYLENNINVALGTDGASSNNNLNMFEEMHLAGIVHKAVNYDASIVKAFDALKMATVNGAKALHFDNLGRLEEGYKADIILLDIDKPHFYPPHNIISNLVYSAQGSDVDTVIVNGKVLYRGREYLTLDFEKIKYNVDRICARIFK